MREIKSMKGKLKIYEAKKITWWQDCPPATNFIAKIFNSLELALIQKKVNVEAKRIKF